MKPLYTVCSEDLTRKGMISGRHCRFRRSFRGPAILAVVLVVSVLVLSCAGPQINSEARSRFEEGLVLFGRGHFQEAVPCFERAVSLEPDYYDANLYLGRAYVSLHKFNQAISPLKKAFRLAPDDFKKQGADLLIDALMGAAYGELKDGRVETALAYAREILDTNPEAQKVKADISRLLVAVAMELAKSGKVREAVREYREALRANPDNADAYAGLAMALLKSGELARALEAAQQAVSLDPNMKAALKVILDLLKR